MASTIPTSIPIILELNYSEELTYDEISRFLAVAIATVMSSLHRARRELKRRMERGEEENEMGTAPDEAFRSEVESEIKLLIGLCGEQPEARERLGVLLRRSPERLRELIANANDGAAVQDMALLLRRLGQPVMEVVLSCFESGD